MEQEQHSTQGVKKRIYPPKLKTGIYFLGVKGTEWAIIFVVVILSLAIFVSTFQVRIFVPVVTYFICCIRIDGEENILQQLKYILEYLLDQQSYISREEEIAREAEANNNPTGKNTSQNKNSRGIFKLFNRTRPRQTQK